MKTARCIYTGQTLRTASTRSGFIMNPTAAFHISMPQCAVKTATARPTMNNIHIHAQEAALKVALQRGWITAAEIHRMNVDKVALMDILRAMPSWSWNDYIARSRVKGYLIMIRPGKKGVYGYSIGMGKAKFKASELGIGRRLTASRIEDIWNILHSQPAAAARLGKTPKSGRRR